MTDLTPENQRAQEMLRIAAHIIRSDAGYSIHHYDDADCDGYCIADDCEAAAENLNTRATPAPVVEGAPEKVWFKTNGIDQFYASMAKPQRYWEWNEYIRADLTTPPEDVKEIIDCAENALIGFQMG